MKAKDALNKILNNNKNSSLIMLTDVFFVASLFLIAYLFNFIIPKESTIQSLFSNGMGVLALFITLSLVTIYIGLIIALYSFAKYVIFFELNNMTKKTKFDFVEFKRFTKTNANIFFVIILLLIIVIIFANIFSPVFGGFLGIFFLICLYFYTNIRQSLFFAGKKYKISQVFAEIGKFKKYRGLFLSNLILIAAWALLFYTTGSILLYYINSFKLVATAYEPYHTASTWITGAFFYTLFFYNRTYFYFAAKER